MFVCSLYAYVVITHMCIYVHVYIYACMHISTHTDVHRYIFLYLFSSSRRALKLKYSCTDKNRSQIATHLSSCVAIEIDMYSTIGWRRPIECLKLQIIFRRRATNYRALLRKMTYKDKARYDSTPPCSI